MAKVFLTDINLSQNELKNAVVQPYAGNPNSNPAVPGKDGQLIYSSTEQALYQYHAGTTNAWVTVGRTIAYDSAGDKVVVSVGGSTETAQLVTIKLGSGYTPVTGGIIATTDTVGDAINKLDTKIKDIVSSGGEPNVIESITVGGSPITITAQKVAEIPTADTNTEGTLTATDWNAFNGKYDLPASGIPKTDLAQGVQDSLGLADTALQSADIANMQTINNMVTSWQGTPDDTHYPSEKLVKDSLDGKQATLATQTAYTSKGTSTKVPQITTNTLGQVTGITEVDINFPSGSGSVTGDATTFVKSVSLSGHTLSGTTQTADSTIDNNSTSIPTSAAVLSFVNSSINNMAAFYITKNANGDPFASKAELNSATTYYSGGVVRIPTLNDYTIVEHDESQAIEVPGYTAFTAKTEYIGFYVLSGSTYTLVTNSNVNTLSITPGTTKAFELPTTRYINTSTTTTPSWSFQYIVNISGLTAAQIAALNSGINATKVGSYDTHVADTTIHVTSTDKTNWNAKLNPVTAVTDDTSKNYVSAVTQSTDGQISVTKGTLATVATSGSYNDLTDQPTIPQGTVTSVQVQATSPVVSSVNTSQTTSLNTTISLASGYGDTQNPYGTKNANTFLAGPTSGSAAAPTFRALDALDLKSIFTASGATFTVQANNSALTPSNGIATWTISAASLTSPVTGTKFDLTKAVVTVFEASTKNEVMTDVTYGDSSNNRILIKINAASNISASTYTCTIMAPLKNS